MNPLEDAQEGRFPGTLGSSLEAAIAALICAKGLQNLTCLRLEMCADEHIWASSLEKATLGTLYLPRFCCYSSSALGSRLKLGWERSSSVSCGKWDTWLLVGLGMILFCMWGWDNPAGLGLGFHIWALLMSHRGPAKSWDANVWDPAEIVCRAGI